MYYEAESTRHFTARQLVEADPLNYLRRINDQVVSSAIQRCNAVVYEMPEFKELPGSLNKHHNAAGGLIRHTAEVVFFAEAAAVLANLSVDRDVLFAAAMWHDFGKIRDYILWTGAYEKTEHAYKVRHLYRSAALWEQTATRERVPEEQMLKVLHCILSHHGDVENGHGSAIDPQTIEAKILHQADMLSVMCGGGIH